MKTPLTMALAAMLAAPLARAQTQSVELVNKVMGSQELAKATVDTAPGAVSAIGRLGIDGDQVVAVDNPRDLSLAIKPTKDGSAFGISFTPARSAIAPMSIATYHGSTWARLLAGTTLAWAQTTTTVNDKAYRQRAFSLETSIYLQPEKDDPAVLYWNALKAADVNKPDDPCVLIPAQNPVATAAAPNGPAAPAVVGEGVAKPATAPAEGDAALKDGLDKRADACRKKALAGARWNASRAWASIVDGRYSPQSGGGSSRGLGKTLVLGASWGFGDAGAARASSLTLAGRKTWDEPTLATLDAASPTRQDSWLVTLRGAYGSATQRVLVEASRLKSDDPTATTRTFKRSLGIDMKIGSGTWLILRTGKQRRVDGNGDESGSSVSLSLSPTELLKF